MIDIVIACVVIGLPTTLALLVLDRISPAWHTPEQERAATGMLPVERATRRRVVSLGVPEPTPPVGTSVASDGRREPVSVGTHPGVAEVASPLATVRP